MEEWLRWRYLMDEELDALQDLTVFSPPRHREEDIKKINHAIWVLGIIISKRIDIDYLRLHTFEEYHDKKEFFVNEKNLTRHEFDAIKEYLSRRAAL